jgi:putative ABC transport system permease protein
MTRLYTDEFFRFPDPSYRLEPGTVAFSFGVSVVTALLGAWIAAKGVMDLPPAEAMRPPSPARYERSRLEKLGLWEWLDPSARMIWRELSRRPVRLVLSAVGVSLAVAIVVVGRSMWDAMDQLMNSYLHQSMREDVTVTLTLPASPRAVREVAHVPGVLYAEGLRQVPVRFRSEHRFRDSAIVGYPEPHRLRQLLSGAGTPFDGLPERGIVLTRKLGEILDVGVGSSIEVELREGQWNTGKVTVAGFVDEPFGLTGHMREQALARLLGDWGAVNTLLLEVDPLETERVERRLKDFPMVASVSSPSDMKRQFDEQSAAIMKVFTFIMTLFAGIIAVGVVYNNTRVALSQRSRELASLRVLGYTRREIATILFGEQAIQVALAIPLGLVLGRWMSSAMMANTDPETYRLTVSVSGTTYAFAIAVTLASAVVSAIIVRRRIQTLDLIAVLKTRE